MFRPATQESTAHIVRMLLVENPFGPSGSIDEQLLATDLPLELTRCKTLKEGMGILNQRDFDVVLLDTELFEADFPEPLYDAVRAADHASVVMIADGDDSRLTAALRAGATDFLMRDDVSAEALRRASRLHAERRLAALERRLLYRIPSLMAEMHDIRTGLTLAVAELCDALDFAVGEVWLPRGARMHRTAYWAGPVAAHQSFARQDADHGLTLDDGVAGRAWQLCEPVRMDDLEESSLGRRELLARQVGLRAAIGVPIRHIGRPVGVIVLFAEERLPGRAEELDALTVAADQIGATLAGLLAEEELAAATRQLEAVALAIDGGLVVLDDRDEILFASRDVERMFGDGGRPLASRRLSDLGWVIAGDDSSRDGESVPNTVIRTGESLAAHIEVPTVEGKARVSVEVVPIRGRAGDIRHVACRFSTGDRWPQSAVPALGSLRN